jgi:hypothetical protein
VLLKVQKSKASRAPSKPLTLPFFRQTNEAKKANSFIATKSH